MLQVLSDLHLPLQNHLMRIKKQLDAVFLDYSKAFDSVLFNCLLRELYGVGIRGKMLSWFRNYLTDRLRMIVIDD